MIYSVYNYATKLYTYYEFAHKIGAHAPKPPRGPAVKPGMGVLPEQAAWSVPFGAKRVGEGPIPRGRVAASSTGLGMGMGGITDTSNLLGLAALGYIGWLVYKKKLLR